ncbi:protein suppressor 2 of zeste-like [Linepithema humile]|uniref:protein suppressor 2 of zeste-like n=1 Tax=Linepithema humile TaxID=83485 RepID=UPI00062303B5|nr:PREDICTED: uncharacterized protein LOC105678196 [Linepithema humile]
MAGLGIGKRTLLRDVNPHLICPLCRGYLIDATTVVECLHSFCRSCILKHLRNVAHCPSCKHALNKAKPNIKADKALQDIVYKLVPGLYHKEMLKRREFYKKHPEHANSATPEQRGEDVSGRLIFSPEDVVSLSLEYSTRRMGPWIALKNTDTDANNSNNTNSNNKHNNNNNHDDNTGGNRRYLQCPALVTVAHLKKFLALKYSVDITRYTIEICHRLAPLPENWTLIDVAYIYPWKRNAPMRLFYRVAKEQRLEAPSHQRPSTPGLGARDCVPPSNAQESSKSEVKSDSNSNDKSVAKELNKKEDEANKTTTTLITTTTNTSPLSTTACKDSNKQIKSPIKILKNPDGKYEVQKSSSATLGWNEKEQTVVVTDADKNLTNPEFSVVNSNGVKITLKQRSPPQNGNTKKPKIVSNVLLSCSPPEKILSALQSQQLQNKSKLMSPVSPDKQEKQRRKVTFVDRLPMSEKTSPSTAMPKTALKKPAEQQEKKQFLQGFQLTAREPTASDDGKVKSPVCDTVAVADKFLQKTNAKAEEFSKKNTEKSNNENVGSKTNNNTTATNVMRKRVASMMSATNPRVYVSKIDSVDGHTFSAGTNPNSKNIVSGNHAAKLDVYTFSNDAPILPAGAVKRKCPPGVPIADLKRRKSMPIAPKQSASKKQNTSPHNSVAKQSHISSAEHVVPTSRAVNIAGDYGGVARVSNVNIAKTSTDPLTSNDTRDFLVDGYGLNIPASLSITLTSPKSPGTSKQFVEPNDPVDNNRKVALGKVNPTITLNNKSVDPRVLKALKTGQMKMPSTPPKAKSATMVATMDRNEAANQQRTTGRQKREHESSRDILDLSGGNKKVEIHPLRIPQPVTKLKTNKNPAPGRNSMQPGGISDQGQVVTLLGGHRYYRSPPGSLTPAAHRVTDCPLPPVLPRAPVYAPSFCGSINRSNSDLSSVFPSLPSLYALHQAPNLQQFQLDTVRLRIPESSSNPGISGMPIKSHLAAQCAPIKPARSSVAPLAVPIAKHSSVNKITNANNNCMGQGNGNNPMDFHSNEGLDSTGEVSQATIQKRFSSNIESTNNKLLSPCKLAKSNDQATVEIKNKDLSVEARNESNDTDNSMMQQQQQRQQQQHREAASPSIVSSTASPSPPPGNGNGGVSARNEDTISRDDENINNTSKSNSATTTPPTKSNIASEVTCSKSPVSPDSSSVTVESSGTNKSCSTSTDQEMPTDSQIASDAAKTSDPPANSHNSSVDDSSTLDDKKKSPSKSETNEITKQLTSEMVQKRLLAVFPSNEWANNPIAAEHLGNFLKSLNATMKSEEHAEGSKAEKADRKPCDNDGTKNDNDASVKSKKDVVERS